MIVADTNLIVHLHIEGERTAEAERIFRRDPSWAVPALWRSEFRNVLSLHIRQGLLTLEKAVGIADEAEQLLTGSEFEVNSGHVLELACMSNCSAYDCGFVALANALGIPLITRDKRVLLAFPGFAVSPERYLA